MKIVQIAVAQETENKLETLYVLTDDGKIYFQVEPTYQTEPWRIVETTDDMEFDEVTK